MDERVDLLELDPLGLERRLVEWGEPSYRSAQIQRWIYHSFANVFDAMTDLPHSLRRRLEESARVGSLTPVRDQASADGLTRKILFKLADGHSVETVLMLYADAPKTDGLARRTEADGDFRRRTVCISTQVGCPIGCPFCATGQSPFVRNLTAGEIVGQVLFFAADCHRAGATAMPLTNIVFMGMGEPLMKFDVTWRAVEALVDPARYGLGARRITISTAGVVPGIERLTKLHSQVNLAVSLHAPDDELRDRLVPINRRFPLGPLIKACRAYVEQTRRRITFEYALMRGINDRPDQARAVASLLGGLLCHVNLIPLNPTPDSPYDRPTYDRVKAFQATLHDAGIAATLRVEKGIEIAAGCGQLRQHLLQGEPTTVGALASAA